MPPRSNRKYRNRKRKRTMRKRYRRRNYNPRSGLVLSGFPTRKLVRLRYVDTGIELNPGAGAIAQTIYRANSILDPFYNAGGHQPMGMDQWTPLYNKYTVLGARCTMRYATLSVNNLTPARFGLLLSSDTTGTASFSDINSLLESKLVGLNTAVCGTQPYGLGKPPQVSKNFSAKRFFGQKDVIDGNGNTGETGDGLLTGTNPSNSAFFIPWCSAQAALQDPGAMNFDIIIDYIVMFHDPTNLDGS